MGRETIAVAARIIEMGEDLVKYRAFAEGVEVVPIMPGIVQTDWPGWRSLRSG
jgi:hypothetical protein